MIYGDPVTFAAGGGGEETGRLSWDFTQSWKDTAVGALVVPGGSATRDSEGAHIVGNGYISIPLAFSEVRFELDVGDTTFTAGTHRRFFMADSAKGLIYRNTGKWALYNGYWYESTETNARFFDNSTIAIEVDMSGNWKIYKDGSLWWAPSGTLPIPTTGAIIGATEQGIADSSFTGLRIMKPQA